jgi:hypothetical protein
MKRMEFHLGPLADRLHRAIREAEQNGIAKRIWRKDASLWKTDESTHKQIRNSLGWLTVPDEMIGVAGELNECAEMIRARGFRHVMVCGMGGSSLCPEVLARTFGRQPGFPELLVLDSTDPDVIARFREQIDVEHCLFVIASKSGTTTEPTVFYKFWYDEVSKRRADPGENFIAITDPGSPLVGTAAELGFQRTFLNQAEIGGRYSALSYFGMVPAALMGVITGCVGGIIRDVLAGQPSILMRPELYVTAAALAAALCAGGTLAGLPPEIVWTVAALAGFALRGAALIWKIELPAYSREPSPP